MFTSIDKAIAAAIMAGVFLINNLTNFHFGISEEIANSIAGVLGTIIVWLIPNKTTA